MLNCLFVLLFLVYEYNILFVICRYALILIINIAIILLLVLYLRTLLLSYIKRNGSDFDGKSYLSGIFFIIVYFCELISCNVSIVQRAVAHVLGLSENKVVCRVKRVGEYH